MLKTKIICIFLLCLWLSGCFVPNKYIATLTLTEEHYTFEFIGEMQMTYMYSEKLSHDATLNQEKAAEQVLAEFKRVMLERKPSIFELRSKTPTLFQTKFAYTSPYSLPEATGLFNIHKKGSTLTVSSRSISAKEYELLKKHKIPSKGILCIKAFGKILESNAPEPANILQQCSTWRLHNLDESVKMVIGFSK